MAEPRFIEESAILGGLDERPNLLAMSATEFEGWHPTLYRRFSRTHLAPYYGPLRGTGRVALGAPTVGLRSSLAGSGR